jgi:hypothetical protein
LSLREHIQDGVVDHITQHSFLSVLRKTKKASKIRCPGHGWTSSVVA